MQITKIGKSSFLCAMTETESYALGLQKISDLQNINRCQVFLSNLFNTSSHILSQAGSKLQNTNLDKYTVKILQSDSIGEQELEIIYLNREIDHDKESEIQQALEDMHQKRQVVNALKQAIEEFIDEQGEFYYDDDDYDDYDDYDDDDDRFSYQQHGYQDYEKLNQKYSGIYGAFKSIDQIIKIAKQVDDKYFKVSALYKHNDLYYIYAEFKKNAPQQMIINVLNEYDFNFVNESPEYIREHGMIIIPKDALNTLRNLSYPQ